MRKKQSPLILGMGNPILSDDRVGLEVARRVFSRLPKDAVVLKETCLGGIDLLFLLEGWKRLLVVDSARPGMLAPGQVRKIPIDELQALSTPITPHHAGLVDCLRLGQAFDLVMPGEVIVYAVGVRDPFTFSKSCTPEVAAAIPAIVDRIVSSVFGSSGCWST